MRRNVVRPPPALLFSCALFACATTAFAGTSTAQNPLVTFTSPGTKQVSLQVCNAGGCHTVVKSVTVLDPMPAVTSFNVSPNFPDQASVVQLSATGSGQPPLAFHWRIVETTSGLQAAELNGATVNWTVNVPPGLYTVEIYVSNSHGQSAISSAEMIVFLPLGWIFSDGFELGNRWVISP